MIDTAILFAHKKIQKYLEKMNLAVRNLSKISIGYYDALCMPGSGCH
jgi:hypothetical protein